MAGTDVHVAVIGAGPGGYAAAFLAADLGMKVTLIDVEKNPGGVCLYRGCIPSKALLNVVKVIHEATRAEEWGVEFLRPEIHLENLREWKTGIVRKLTAGLGQLVKQRKIIYIQGKARFVNSTTLTIENGNKQQQKLSYDYAILAAGSIPATLPDLPLGSDWLLDSTRALEIRRIPKSLLVVGGGYIGLELGTVYAGLGTKVTVVEMLPGLLPGADRDLVSQLARRINGLFEEVLLETTIGKVKVQKNGVQVQLYSKGDSPRTKMFENVLVSVGRKPNSQNLGLENTGVQQNAQGFVQVNGQRRTHDPRIFAIGDVVGEPMLAHKAIHEGKVAVEAIAGEKTVFEPRAIPAVVYTDPEIAWCGLTEAEARRQNRPVRVVRFPWTASGRATALGRNDGVTKLIVDPDTEQVLGVGIAGSGAGELITEGVLAIEMAAVARDLDLTIHPHPTLSETIMEAAGVFLGTSTHLYRPGSKK